MPRTDLIARLAADLTPDERGELLRLLTEAPRVEFVLRPYTPPKKMGLLAVHDLGRRCDKFMRTAISFMIRNLERGLPVHPYNQGEKEYYEARLLDPDPIRNGSDHGKPTPDFLYTCPCCMKKNPD